jgi:hypothetical protein
VKTGCGLQIREVLDLLQSDASEAEVTAYLHDIEINWMGVRGNPSLSEVVTKLFDVYS